MKTVKIGIIGCGWFGNVHLQNLMQLEQVQVVALANTGKEKLERTGQKVPDAHRYQDWRQMFEQEKGNLDAVVICVTPDRHEEIEETAAANGVAFYVEKPIGLEPETVLRKLDAVKKAGIITSTGYQERYNPQLIQLKQWMEEHPVVMASGSWIGGMPGAAWWRRKAQSGGQLVEQCTHIFDMMRYLFGEASQVYTISRNDQHPGVENCDVDDCSMVTVRWKNGLVSTVTTACFQQDGALPEVGLKLYAKDGTVQYFWGDKMELMTQGQSNTISFPGDHHLRAMEAFVKAVREGDPSGIQSDYEDGVKSLLLTLAARQSSDEKRPIDCLS